MVAAVLCAVVFWPGVVSQANLDAKPVNALAAIGVLLALALTIAVARSGGVSRTSRRRGDIARIVIAVVLLVVVRAVGRGGSRLLPERRTRAREHLPHRPRPTPGVVPYLPTVHHGHHHGMDGYLLVLTALLLSRTLGEVRLRGLRTALTGYLALMLCYGLGNIANDLWIEQVWKRGWASWQIPNVLEPRPTVAWAVLLAATAAIWIAARRTA